MLSANVQKTSKVMRTYNTTVVSSTLSADKHSNKTVQLAVQR